MPCKRQTGLQLGKYFRFKPEVQLCALPLVAVTLRSDQLLMHWSHGVPFHAVGCMKSEQSPQQLVTYYSDIIPARSQTSTEITNSAKKHSHTTHNHHGCKMRKQNTQGSTAARRSQWSIFLQQQCVISLSQDNTQIKLICKTE